jgi:baseplate J-like protein
MPTNVPRPTFGPNGFVAPSEAAILSGVQADINAAFGGNLRPGLSTPQGQIATTEAAAIGDSYATFLYFVNGVDPALNSGRLQDAIGRIYYMSRLPGKPTVQNVACSGLDGVVIPIGAIAQDPSGNLWICQTQGTIASGSVTLPFACATFGPTPGPPSLTIYQTIFGWDSATPTGDAVLGQLVESASAFEARRAASVAANAVSMLDAVQGSVLAVPGVVDCYCVENDNAYPILRGGFVLGRNSLYACVLGGSAQAIANAIWLRKMPGCGYNGSTIETVVDPSPAYLPPIPSYQVAFQIPLIIPFAVLVVIRNNPMIPTNAATLVKNTIVNAFAGLDGGPRARIGSLIFASRYYAGIAVLGPWAQLVGIRIGRSGVNAGFTASISATVMTVTAVSYGALAINQLLQDVGGNVQPGTVILGFGTGTGGTGTYLVSISQNLSSEDLTATTLMDDVLMEIMEAPAVSAANVYLAFQTNT